MENAVNKDYIHRINKVMDYIYNNLQNSFSLEELSEIACFSPFHFHRVFTSLTGETLNGFINRVRLEKSAYQLLNNKDKSITEIALDCGFSGSSVFSRSFKQYFKMSPSSWKKCSGNINSKNCINLSKTGQDKFLGSLYINYTNNIQQWRMKMNNQDYSINVKESQELIVAYVRHTGPYEGNASLFEKLFGKLCTWAGARGLLGKDEKFLVIYHDSPEITDDDKLRLSVCVTVPPDTVVEGEIGKLVLPPGKSAYARFNLNKDEFGEAWNWVYGVWMPQSGYEPDDRPCYELYHETDKSSGKEFTLDIVVPVKPV